MKIRLKKRADAGEREVNEIHEVLSRIEANFSKLGLAKIQRPIKRDGEPLDPALPPDLTMLNDTALGRIHGEFAAMAKYVQLELARRAVQAAVTRKMEKKIRAKVRLTQSGTNPDKEAKTEADGRVQAVVMAGLVHEGVETLTQSMMAAYLIGRDAASREMSRRQAMNNGR